MAYVFVSDFKYGMDRRRPRFAGVPGTLWEARNVHLTRGGDIERRKSFVATYTGLSNTFGLEETNGQLYVFGSADLAGSMPLGVQYQRLVAPSSPAMTRVVDVKKFDNKFYVIAEYDNGTRYHFYNGARVSSWDTVSASLASAGLTYRTLAVQLNTDPAVQVVPISTGVVITASTPGTPFTLSASIANGAGVNDQTAAVTAVQANVAAVAEVRATTQISVTGGTFDPNVNTIAQVMVGATMETAIGLLPAPISWVNSDDSTATAIAATINEGTDAHGYSASVAGSTITISAVVGLGAAANSYFVWTETTGTATATPTAAFAGGVTAVAPVAQVSKIVFGGTFEADDTITVVLNGTTYKLTGQAAATGGTLHVQNNRVFSGAGPAVCYCKLNDPTDWTDATQSIGAGRIIVSTDANGTQNINALAPYQGYIAIFGDTAVLVYDLGTDSAQFGRVQEVPNTGTISGRGVLGYGATDVFYLDSSGVRSLRARDASNLAIMSDVGSVFDPFVQEVVAAATRRQVQDAKAVIEPTSNSYWLAIGSTILVLTNYQQTEVRGWTYYTAEFPVLDMLRSGSRLYLRSSDTIYLYGGASGNVYPAASEAVAEVKLPFLTARDDAGVKQFIGFDIGASNDWSTTALVDPKNESETIYLGIYSGVTYAEESSEIIGETSHLALDFTCSAAGNATLSNFALHHNGKMRK